MIKVKNWKKEWFASIPFYKLFDDYWYSPLNIEPTRLCEYKQALSVVRYHLLIGDRL